MAGYRITWTSHTGVTVDLSMDALSDSGVWIRSISGFTSAPSVATVGRTNGRGEIPTALTTPKMEGSMVLHIDPSLANKPDTVSTMWSYLVGLFSTVRMGTMTIHQPDGTSLSSQFYASAPVDFPGERSPHTPGIREMDMALTFWSPVGGWEGVATAGTAPVDGVRTIYNRGDLDAYLTLELAPGGTPASRTYQITLAGGSTHTVIFPSVSGIRYIDTDPGHGFAIELADGTRDRAAQVGMRGQFIPGLVPTGESVSVMAGSNITATLTPYYLSPWR